MIRPVFSVACWWVFGLALTGCATSTAPPPANPQPIDAAYYRATFDAGAEVLRDAGFRVDRRDFRFGVITSQPKGSPTVFEPWQPDNSDGDQAWQSTVGDLRRTVTLSFAPPRKPGPRNIETPTSSDAAAAGDPAAGYALRVEVLIERLQVPQRRLNGRTRGSVFADLSETPAELRRRGINGRYWQPIGRDVQLEARLLEKILARSASPAG